MGWRGVISVCNSHINACVRITVLEGLNVKVSRLGEDAITDEEWEYVSLLTICGSCGIFW
jgi:hypothetical protein